MDDGNGENDVGEASTQQQHEENNYMGQFRGQLATSIWNNRYE